MASAHPVEAVDLFSNRHAAIRPWPGCILPHTPRYLGLACNDGILQRVSRGEHARLGFFQFEHTFRAYLVLISLHAIDDTALSRRYVAAIFLDIL